LRFDIGRTAAQYRSLYAGLLAKKRGCREAA
jgi:hypothetical protein